MTEQRFSNKCVVVTGAASGIGEALCGRFAREGAAIGLLDLDGDAAQTTAQALSNSGTETLAQRCDVADAEACHKVIAQIEQRFGGIDVLINNAGITQRSAFSETDMAVYRRVMDVNFFGSVHCTKAALNTLTQRRGMIIAIESLAGVTPLLGRTGYSASKHAMHGFFTSLRAELRPVGVQVLIVCPGFVETNLQKRALGGDGKVTDHPQSTIGKPATVDDVADAIFEATCKRKPFLVLTPMGKLAYWISRFAPGVYERLMARKFRSELER